MRRGASKWMPFSQNLLELLFLVCRQRCRELDAYAHDEVAALVGLLALWHSEIRETFGEGRSGRSATADGYLLSVDRLYGPSPASKGFFEVKFDDVLDVVAFAGEKRMGFLRDVSIGLEYDSSFVEIDLPLTQ